MTAKMFPVAISFNAVFGVVAGYGHDNANLTAAEAEALAAKAWMAAMNAEMEAGGMVVSATLTAGRVLYPSAFGCPEGGEVVVTACGNSNPAFVPKEKLADYQAAVVRVVEATKNALEQARVQLSFSDISGFVYLEPEVNRHFEV